MPGRMPTSKQRLMRDQPMPVRATAHGTMDLPMTIHPLPLQTAGTGCARLSPKIFHGMALPSP
jgi:hypothetical protein